LRITEEIFLRASASIEEIFLRVKADHLIARRSNDQDGAELRERLQTQPIGPANENDLLEPSPATPA
jgi:hypothetical protein